MSALLRIEVANENGLVLVKLIGEARLDIEDVAFQLDRVIAHHPKVILVDATELSFLSSLGMSLLVNLRRTAAKSGGIVKIAGLQPFIRDALAHARLLEMFEVFPDVASVIVQATAPVLPAAP